MVLSMAVSAPLRVEGRLEVSSGGDIDISELRRVSNFEALVPRASDGCGRRGLEYGIQRARVFKFIRERVAGFSIFGISPPVAISL